MCVNYNAEKGWTNYAKLWHIEMKGKYADVRLSTSEKDQEGNWQSSNWNTRFVGAAKNKLEGMEGKERIILTKFKISNPYIKEKDKSYLNFTVFDFDQITDDGTTSKMDTPPQVDDDESEDSEPW